MSFIAASGFAAGHDFTEATYGSTPYLRYGTQPITNGSTFLTLWNVDTFSGGWHLWASVADENGNLISSAPFHTYSSPGDGSVQVVAAANEYVVFTTAPSTEDLRPLPAMRIVHLDHATSILASNGANFLALQPSYGPDPNTLELLDREGNVARSAIVRSAAAIAAATSGGDFVIVLSDTSGVRFQRIASNGDATPALVLDGSPVSPNAARPSVTSNGSETVIVWGSQYAVIARDGSIIRRATLPTGGRPSMFASAVVSSASNFVVVAAAGTITFSPFLYQVDIIAIRIDRQGNIVDQEPALIRANGGTIFGIAATSTRVFLTLGSTAFTFPAADLHDVRSQVMTVMQRRQFAPAVASDGVDFLGDWLDQTGESAAITVGRMTRGGIPLDGPGLDLMRVDGVMGSYDVAFGGSIYLVVWHWYQQIWGRRIALDGTVIDAQPIIIRNGDAADPIVRWNGHDFVVMWPGGDATDATINAAILSTAGEVGPAREVFRFHRAVQPYGNQFIESFSAAWDGKEFLLVTEVGVDRNTDCCVIPNAIETYVRAIRLTADAKPIDDEGITVASSVHSSEDGGARPRVATSGTEFLISFIDPGNQVSTVVVHLDSGLRVDAPVSQFRWFKQVGTDVAWNGREYVVAMRYGINNHAGYAGAFSIARDGHSIGFVAAGTGPYDFFSLPAVATNEGGDALVAISEIRTPGEDPRVRGYFVNEMTPARRAPGAPQRVDAVRSGDNITVTWSDDSGTAAGYLVQVGTYEPVIVSASARSFTFRAPQDFARVIAFNESGYAGGAQVTAHAPPPRHRPAGH